MNKRLLEAIAPPERPAFQGSKVNAVGMNGDGVTNSLVPCCPEDEPTRSPFDPGGGLDTEDVLGSIFQRMGIPPDEEGVMM